MYRALAIVCTVALVALAGCGGPGPGAETASPGVGEDGGVGESPDGGDGGIGDETETDDGVTTETDEGGVGDGTETEEDVIGETENETDGAMGTDTPTATDAES